MTRNETPAESLKGYLRQLSPQTRAKLLAEIERLRQNGEDVPGGDLLLKELRADSRQDGRAIERLDQPARHFFRPLEPYLTDRPPERANAGQISRASLPPIWDWIGRDLMASLVRSYLTEMKQFIATGSQHEIEQAVVAFQNKAVKYLEGPLKSTSGMEQARSRLVAYGAAKAGLDDLTKMMRALRAREPLTKFAEALPAKIDKLDGARLDKTRAALDALAAKSAESGAVRAHAGVPAARRAVAAHPPRHQGDRKQGCGGDRRHALRDDGRHGARPARGPGGGPVRGADRRAPAARQGAAHRHLRHGISARSPHRLRRHAVGPPARRHHGPGGECC